MCSWHGVEWSVLNGTGGTEFFPCIEVGQVLFEGESVCCHDVLRGVQHADTYFVLRTDLVVEEVLHPNG